MGILDLDGAVSQIVQAAVDKTFGTPHPFVFVVGAGLSHPSVPLAQDLVTHCQDVASKHRRTVQPSGASPIDVYSHWFEQAYPNARQRQRYLRSLIEGRPISGASLRLAHLLLDGQVSLTVVTPNFDDFISRALTLFGKSHVVCDHPATVDRIDPEHSDIQIVHVHGSYWFYDCCNLRGEIEARAQLPAALPMTMLSVIEDLLGRRSPLVIGYSGWEGDVIMTALRRRLSRPLPYNVYWFCFKRSDIAALPSWLVRHRCISWPHPKT